MENVETKQPRIKRETREIQVEIPMIDAEEIMRGEDDNPASAVPAGVIDMLNTFKANTKNLIFRQIEQVFHDPAEEEGTVHFKPLPNGQVQTTIYERGAENIPSFTPEEEENNVEVHCKKFYCIASSTPLRPGTGGEVNIAKGTEILLESQNYSQIDFLDKMNFQFSKREEDRANTALPRKPRYVGKQKCTDMACILPGTKKNGKVLKAEHWFVCSPQFLRLWTLLHYPKHETLKKLGATEELLRKKIFSNNTTITNSYLAWTNACIHNGLISDMDELECRFRNLRTEYVSRQYAHIYAALAMILKYFERPCFGNVPRKLDDGPHLLGWVIPEGWLERLFEMYSVRILPDLAIRFLEVPVYPEDFTPKGTTRATAFTTIPVGADMPRASGFAAEKKWGDYQVDEYLGLVGN